MRLVEGKHFFEGEITDDVAVKDKENARFILIFDDVFSQFKRASCSHGFCLLRIGQLDIVLLLERFQGCLDISCLIIDSDDNLCDSDFGKSLTKLKDTAI